MAAALPGVGVHQRRKPLKHFASESPCNRLGRVLAERRRDLLINDTTNSLDETVLRARQRLEQKLGYLQHSSRSSEVQQNEGGNNKTGIKNTSLTSKLLLGSKWHLKLIERCKSRKLCSVCLEDFQAQERVTILSCSHKYHSDCLYPWLATHPHCPYCRTPVLQS